MVQVYYCVDFTHENSFWDQENSSWYNYIFLLNSRAMYINLNG